MCRATCDPRHGSSACTTAASSTSCAPAALVTEPEFVEQTCGMGGASRVGSEILRAVTDR
jgi:hypothetical protein